MGNEKLTEVSVSYFFRADDYRDEIWYKENTKESNRDYKSYGIIDIDLSFKIAIAIG